MRMRTILTAAVILGTAGVAGTARAGQPPLVEAPKVLAGDYVDTSSVQTIVADLFTGKADWSDEQKVLNFYHWLRRVMYPFRNMGGDRRHVTKAINTAGFNLCGSQAGVALMILREAGYDVRQVNANVGPEWGHTFWEVKYDGRWHLFDAMTAFYVMTRDNPPHVASADELEADPTLVTKAIEEGRVSPEFLYSMRNHEINLEQRARFQAETKGADVPWSLLVTRPGSMLDFWTAAAERKKISCAAVNSLSGGHDTPGVLDVRLKANERYVRRWDNVGKWLIAPSFAVHPPANMSAGANEHFDVINYRYFEPYRVEKPNPFNKAIYRSYGNGWLDWQPASAEQLAQGVETMTNLAADADGTLRLVDATKPGSILIPVKSPYGVVEATLKLALPPPATGASVELLVGRRDANNRLTWRRPVAVPTELHAVEGEATAERVATHSLAMENPSAYDFAWRVTLSGDAKTSMKVIQVHTLFQCSPMALPGLAPGVNRVRVSAAAPTQIAGGTLRVSYGWLDAPDWKQERTDVRELTELPAQYEIALPDGDKLPRMRSLELFLAPR